jgi:hypothetical protein
MIQPPSVWMLFTGNRKSLLQVTISALCETVVLGGWLSWHIVAIRTLQRGCAALPCSGVQFGTCPSVIFQRYPIRDTFFSRKTFLPRGSAVWYLSPQTSIGGKGLT